MTPGLLVLILMSAAQQPQARPSPTDVCIDVWVEGERAPPEACLNERLRASADAGARRAATLAGRSDEAQASRPTRDGTFSRSAVAQRLGSGFGQGVTPIRPAPPVYRPPQIPAPQP